MNKRDIYYEATNHVGEEENTIYVSSDFFLPYNPCDIQKCNVYGETIDITIDNVTYSCKRTYDGTLRAMLSYDETSMIACDLNILYEKVVMG